MGERSTESSAWHSVMPQRDGMGERRIGSSAWCSVMP